MLTAYGVQAAIHGPWQPLADAKMFAADCEARYNAKNKQLTAATGWQSSLGISENRCAAAPARPRRNTDSGTLQLTEMPAQQLRQQGFVTMTMCGTCGQHAMSCACPSVRKEQESNMADASFEAAAEQQAEKIRASRQLSARLQLERDMQRKRGLGLQPVLNRDEWPKTAFSAATAMSFTTVVETATKIQGTSSIGSNPGDQPSPPPRSPTNTRSPLMQLPTNKVGANVNGKISKSNKKNTMKKTRSKDKVLRGCFSSMGNGQGVGSRSRSRSHTIQ